MRHLRILAPFAFFVPSVSLALLNGGAGNRQEMQQIEQKVGEVKKLCPLDDLRKSLSPQDAQKIGRNLLYNETSCKPGDLAEWDKNEAFPSIGVPHVIWFPSGVEKNYDESFPRFWKYLQERNRGSIPIPTSLNRSDIASGSVPALWDSKKKFDEDPQVRDLNRYLTHPTVLGWQTDFSIQRGFDAAYKVLATNTLDAKPKMSTEVMCRHFRKLFSSPGGVMSVVDYANFKGEGIYPSETKGSAKVRWGLKQVIESMDDQELEITTAQRNKILAIQDAKEKDLYGERQKFASATKLALKRRVAADDTISPRLGEQWLKGWGNRIDRTYVGEGISPSQCPLMPGVVDGSNSTASPSGSVR